MTEAGKYELGTGKYRLGNDGRYKLTVFVQDDQHLTLEKLRVVRGYQISEVVQVALESFFSMPLSEIDAKMRKKRGHF